MARRVEEELEKRREEIEAEVLRRVEEAKRLMEQQMLEELQEKRRQQEEDQKKREVKLSSPYVTGDHSVAILSCVCSNSTHVRGGREEVMVVVVLLQQKAHAGHIKNMWSHLTTRQGLGSVPDDSCRLSIKEMEHCSVFMMIFYL